MVDSLTLVEMADLPQAHGFEVVGRAAVSAIRRTPGYTGERALAVLAHAIAERAFPGAAFAVSRQGETLLQGAVGRFTYDDASDEITLSTIFDLASVTKVVATTAMAMLLYDRGLLSLEQPVAQCLPEFAGSDARRKRVSVAMLLAHSSGLPAYERMFERADTREKLLELTFQVPLQAEPGSRAEYSDIGFILLGELLSRIAGETIDQFCAREIFAPLAMKSTCFRPPQKLRTGIPPTIDDRSFRHRVIQGEVHDENSSVMGGVSGHAGVFANTTDLMKFSASLLGHGPRLFRKETVRLFATRQAIPSGTSRALGWDTPSAPSQSGKHFSEHSFGHLGYTGTSLWIDGEREIAIVLLTNRTWPDNQSKLIKRVRPLFHDAVMEELLEKPE
jgi:serine-type D-Ala-D-Ala carboxypeptidase